jgi:hypothetical protein
MQKKKVFIIMPFDVEFNELYVFIKKQIEKDSSFQVFRADDLVNQQNILKDIVQSINISDLIIADLTDLNANVFYELGLAHALRKNVILLTQDIQELPFDLRSYRVIEYSTHFSKVKELEEKLNDIITKLKEDKVSFGSPVTDWIPLQEYNKMEVDDDSNIKKTEDDVTMVQPQKEDVSVVNGFLDFIADIDESMAELTDILQEFSQQTEKMGNEIGSKTKEIEETWKNPSSGTASYVRKLARKTASIMNSYGIFASGHNKKYEELWGIFDDSLSKLIISDLIGKTEENLSGFIEFLEAIEGIKGSIIIARDQFQLMVKASSELKGIQKDISRASTLIEREVNIFIGHLDKSMSTLDRALAIGKDHIKKFS